MQIIINSKGYFPRIYGGHLFSQQMYAFDITHRESTSWCFYLSGNSFLLLIWQLFNLLYEYLLLSPPLQLLLLPQIHTLSSFLFTLDNLLGRFYLQPWLQPILMTNIYATSPDISPVFQTHESNSLQTSHLKVPERLQTHRV